MLPYFFNTCEHHVGKKCALFYAVGLCFTSLYVDFMLIWEVTQLHIALMHSRYTGDNCESSVRVSITLDATLLLC